MRALRNPACPEAVKLFYKNEGWVKHQKRKHGGKAKRESPKPKKRDTSGDKVRVPNSTLDRKLRIVHSFREKVPAQMTRKEFIQVSPSRSEKKT